MFWIAVAIVIAALLVIEYFKRHDQLKEHLRNINKPSTIEERNQSLREDIEKLQDKLLEILRKTTWAYANDFIDEVTKLSIVNTKVCTRYRDNQQVLFEQQSDWLQMLNLYLEEYYPMPQSKDKWTEPITPDEVGSALRGTERHELYKRIMARYKAKHS